MKAAFRDDRVYLEGSPFEIVLIKTKLSRRFGPVIRSELRGVSFPECLLLDAEELLPTSLREEESIAIAIARIREHAAARTEALRRISADELVDVPERWTTRLERKQSVAVSALITPGIFGLCVFDEQGTGKTVMALAAYDIMRDDGRLDGMIVVCPKSMLAAWPDEAKRFLNESLLVRSVEGSAYENQQSVLNGFDVLVLNYEKVAQLASVLVALGKKKRFLLVVDESYYVKNVEAIRSEALATLRRACAECFVLCGTPAPNSAYDLVNQFNLADRGYTFALFSPSRDESEDILEIDEALCQRGLFIRRLKTEVLPELGEKRFQIIPAVLSGKQELLYESARQKLILELKGLDNKTFRRQLTSYFQRRAVLLQICSCPQAVDPTFAATSAKIAALDGLLHELVTERKRKVVLWSFYKASVEELFNRYARFNPVLVDGSVSSGKRRDAVRRFQGSSDTMLFIGNPAAAGAGITLHAASDAVYVSFSNQAAHYLQSLDRVHRRGQIANEVNYYFLVCQGTIEENEVTRLRATELAQHSLLGDRIPFPSSIDDALAELGAEVRIR